MKREPLWLIVHLALGLAWIALLASRAPGDSGIGATGPQVFVMLVAAGWLPSLALAFWQMRHRRLCSLLLSDLLGGGALLLLACTVYLPLFFFNVAWFLPLVLLPRGVVSELLVRSLTGRTNTGCRTFEQLLQREQERGYKPGWARHVWAARQHNKTNSGTL